jgi:hypothetical protein
VPLDKLNRHAADDPREDHLDTQAFILHHGTSLSGSDRKLTEEMGLVQVVQLSQDFAWLANRRKLVCHDALL